MSLLLVDAGFGGTITDPEGIPWVDISQYVDLDNVGVTITRGASDELSEIQPATCSMTLNNQDGRFTADLASSPYYPNVVMNTPIRVSVATLDSPTGAAPWPLEKLCDDFDDGRIDTAKWTTVSGGVTEAGGRVRIPAAAGVTAQCQSARQWRLVNSYTTVRMTVVPAATGASTAFCSFMVNAVTSGTRVGFLYNAITGMLSCRSDVAFADAGAVSEPYDPQFHQFLRIRETSGKVYWEASSDGFGWFVLRDETTPAWVTSNQVNLQLAANRNSGPTDYAEFDLVGAVVHPRFWGMVNEWPNAWNGLYSTVSITATDLFKWLNLQPSLRPLLSEEILQLEPVSYYPMSEPEGSTSVGDLSGQTTAALGIVQAGSGGTLTFSGVDGPPATAAQCPVFAPASASAGRYLTADLGPKFEQDASATAVVTEVWFRTTTAGRTMCALRSLDNTYRIAMGLDGTGKLQVTTTSPGAGTLVAAFSTPNLANDTWHQAIYDENFMEVWVDGVQYGPLPIAVTHDLRRLSVGGDFGTTLWSGAIAHVAVYTLQDYLFIGSEASNHYDAGINGFEGEPADFRVERLGWYTGIDSVTSLGSTFDDTASQGPGGSRALDMMKAIEATEGAKLFADRDWAGVTFQSRDLRYNPVPEVVLSYGDLETDEVEGSLDDQKMVNTVIASRPGGATQRVVDQASRDRYGPAEKTLDLLKTDDNKVLDAANWLVSRYAHPRGELREVPIAAYSMGTATYRDLLNLGISSVITVTDLPAQTPTPEQTLFIEGYQETIRYRRHHIQFHTSRSYNDSVWVLNDPVYSVLGSTTRLSY